MIAVAPLSAPAILVALLLWFLPVSFYIFFTPFTFLSTTIYIPPHSVKKCQSPILVV